jgi:hypothetical protein
LQLQRVVNGDVTTLATLKSAAWFSQKWVVASLDLEGNVVRVRVQRTDTGQFLNNQGQWQTQPAWALQVIDSALAGPGQVGLGRRGSYSGTVTFDDIGITVATPAEAFDHTALGTLPAGWSQWSNSGQRTFAVSNYRSLSPGNGLVMSSNLSSLETRTWLDDLLPADVQVSAGVFLDSLIPALVLARGRNLDTATPSYYSLSLARGLDLGLVRVVNGIPTPLASLRSSGWFSQRWVMATLEVQGDRLRVRVYRPDFGQFLNSQGQWQNGPVWALEITDTSLAGPGLVGLGRPASYAGMVIFDNFCVTVPPTGESFDRTSS